jgi:hypothetical protein
LIVGVPDKASQHAGQINRNVIAFDAAEIYEARQIISLEK